MANFSFSTTVTIASSASLSDAANFVDDSLFYQERPALCGIYRYDIVGTSDVAAGWTQTADDATMIAFAIGEVET